MVKKVFGVIPLAVIVTISIIMSLSSCGSDTIYINYRHTPTPWEKNDTLLYITKKMKVTGEYQEFVELRTTEEYPFSSVTLIIDQQSKPSGFHASDTLKCQIADKHGVFGGSGFAYRQFEFPLRKVKIPIGDSLKVTIRHNMRHNMLEGITDVGLRLTH
ncbi:MAG: gliding motility lipoprotein GldH [Prevotella sp.]|jgi:gliding motility-associated lipoprotein GldH|nr:gliding motility lipoprotein GldH [Prevotella sp.]